MTVTIPVLAVQALPGLGQPVAYLRRNEGVTEWARGAGPAPDELPVLLITAGQTQPQRIFRETTSTGRTLTAEPVDSNDPGWPIAWADALTASPVASGRFVVRPSTAPPPQLAFSEVPLEVLCSDALDDKERPTPTVRCPCGARYAVWSAECEACEGADPLSQVLAGGDPSMARDFALGLMDGSLTSNELRQASWRMVSVLRDHLKVLEEPASSFEEMDDGPRAAASRADLERRLSPPGGTGEIASGLKQTLSSAPVFVWTEAARIATVARRTWKPGAELGWVRPPDAEERLLKEHAACARTTLEASRCMLEAQTTAVAQFVPVRRMYQKIEERTWYGDMLRGALTAFSAFNTFGASLLLKGAMWAVKEERDARALAALEDALSELGQTVGALEEALQGLVQQQSANGQARRQALAKYLVSLLAHDYAIAEPKEQLQIARLVAASIGVRRPWRDRRGRGRGLVPIAALAGRWPALIAGITGIAGAAAAIYLLFH